MADSKVIMFPGGKNVIPADLIPADILVPDLSVSKFELRTLAERVESITKALQGQSDVIAEICDAGNNDVPGVIANGADSTLLWAVAQLEEVKESLAKITKSCAGTSGAGSAA